MFLNTFHRKHILLKLKIKNILRKISSKNLTAGVFYITLEYITVVLSIFAFWEILHAFLYFESINLENSFRNTIRVSNSLDPDQA